MRDVIHQEMIHENREGGKAGPCCKKWCVVRNFRWRGTAIRIPNSGNLKSKGLGGVRNGASSCAATVLSVVARPVLPKAVSKDSKGNMCVKGQVTENPRSGI